VKSSKVNWFQGQGKNKGKEEKGLMETPSRNLYPRRIFLDQKEGSLRIRIRKKTFQKFLTGKL